MTTFSFKAVDLGGIPTRGEVEARDKKTVTAQLRTKGLIVLNIEEQANTDVGDMLARFRRVKTRDLTVATRQLSTMVSSGMSLLRALYVLEEQTSSNKLRETLVEVRKDIEAGLALSEGMRRHPDVFSELYVAMVAAGESGGILDATLMRVAEQLEKDDSLRRQVKAAMVYPLLIGSLALVVLIALVAFLVPVFENTFEDLGGELPLVTRLTVTMSHFVTGQWYLLLAGTLVMVVLFRRWKESDRGRLRWDRLKLAMPMRIGGIVRQIALARFARTLAGLRSAGVPMLEAIDITSRASGNRVVERATQEVYASVKRGGSLNGPMRKSPQAFPVMVAQMVGVGEKTGELDAMLTKVADFYEDEVNAALKALTSILEPAMIIAVGVIVGFIVISMYLPMFNVYGEVR